jgi:iron complex transport system ATP-binding protein
MSGYFTTDHLTVGYGGKPLIRDICLSIRKGEILTLVGPNGGGKSTILKSITRHLRHIGGRVTVDGQNLMSLSGKDMARRVSVMLTERVSPELMTCGDVVESGRYPYTNYFGLLTPEDHAIVEDSLAKVRALELRDRSFDAVSDGQRQRVMLARALCQQPDIIVLDEPTSFLDIRHKIELLDILREMARVEKITIILSLHEIDLAAKVSDRVVCVKGETVEHFGPPEEVFAGSAVAELYDMQTGSYNTLLGSLELPKPIGSPRVFVLSGGGRGIPVFRALQKRATPFAAGILFDNDMDYPVAVSLASEVFAVAAFTEPPESMMAGAVRCARACGWLLDTGAPVHPAHARLLESKDIRVITSWEDLP